jgi:hypothetical protein
MQVRSTAKLTALLMLPLIVAACGGSGAGTPGPIASPDPAPLVTAPAVDDPGASLPEAIDEPSQPPTPAAVARPIPAVPRDEAKDSTDFTDGKHVALGRDALDFSQCEVSGTAMSINPDGVAAGNADNLPAWALYRISGLADDTALSLNGNILPHAFDMAYRIAVADYQTLDWVWLSATTFPEYQFDLTAERQFISDQGNLHFLVVCDGENSAVHYRSTVALDDGVESEPPILYDLAGYVYGFYPAELVIEPGGAGTEGSTGSDPGADEFSPLVRQLDTETEDIASEEYNGGGIAAQPLAGVQVLLTGREGTVLADVLTDENGAFELVGVEPGDYQITTQLSGWMFQPAEYPLSLAAEPDEAGTLLQLDFLGWPAGL